MIVERLLKVALLGSSWVLYLLLSLSVLSFATMFERYLYFKRHGVDFDALRRQLRKHLQDEDLTRAEQLLVSSSAIEARVALEALRWSAGGPGAMTDAVDSELARVKTELERGSNLLGTLGNNAPFVGLLGTVLGVIISFHALGDAGQNTQAMGGVMAGIAEALVATGVGLFVALPAVVAYNVIQKRIGEIESGALSLTKLLTAYVRAAHHGTHGGALGGEAALERESAADADIASASAVTLAQAGE
ncbi:MAG TPA: MotA/TolQ/ExbB proton channel family protein [Polyangiaceae bacterium]|jgi:biopolymer transport protein ExbB/TolQ|nr:MotA/TolQ/ExbB proton channel family protein [Polyangiaceae bacterium]